MMTVRQIERLWTAKSYDKLMDSLLRGRWEGEHGREVCGASAVVAGSLAMIRLDELNQSDAPIFRQLLRTVLAAQESDGGWGEVTATVWALRALLIDGGGGAAVERGMAHLAELQQAEGIWPGIPLRRMPADPLVSAFILAELGDSGGFRRRVRFMDAVNWFTVRSTLPGDGGRVLDDESRAMWGRARLRCRATESVGWRAPDEAGDGPSWTPQTLRVEPMATALRE